jgi:hypothetical protein
MRIERLLKGRDDIEAEGSSISTIWDETVTQLSDLFSITIADRSDRVATSTVILSRLRDQRNELTQIQMENETLRVQTRVAKDFN